MSARAQRVTALVRRVLRRVRRGETIGALEIPSSGAVVAPGRLRIIGWAVPADRPVGRIEVRVDGETMGCARPCATARRDVARARRAPGAPLAGYEHVVTISGAPGQHLRLDVDVIDIDGRSMRLRGADLEVGVPDANLPTAPSVAAPRVQRAASSDLRVVVFTHQLDIGGGQLYLQELVRGLLSDPGRSFLVVSTKDGALRAELEALGAEVLVLDAPMVSTEVYEARVAVLQHITRAFGPDVALVNTMTAGIGADVAVRLGIPTIWAIHESYRLDDYWIAAYGERGVAPEVRACITRALSTASAVIFEADATRAVYEPVVQPNRAVTVRYGIPVARILGAVRSQDVAAVRRSVGIDGDATVVLCMGTFEPRKAQGALALAFAEVAGDFPHAVLVLVGDRDDEYSVGVRELVQRLGLGHRIRIEPIVDDPYPWYAAADAFLLASDIESMPRTLLEVMAFGVPVAAASAWGVPELVCDGENGLLFAPRDVNALRTVVRRMLALSPEERARLGAAGARTIAEQHDAAGYIDAYRRLLPAIAADPTVRPADVLARSSSSKLT